MPSKSSCYNPPPQATALASLHPHHLTISGAVLDQLAALPEVPADRLAPPPTPKYSEDAFGEYR